LKNRKWLKLLPRYLHQKLDGRISAQIVIANTGWLAFDKASRLFIGIIIGTWIARYLGPTEFGELSYFLVYISFFQVIASLGLDGIVIRELARDKTQAEKVLGSAVLLKLSAGMVFWILAILITGISSNWDSRSLFLVGIIGSGIFLQASEVIDLWFQSENQIKRTVFAKLLSYCISNGLRVILILMEAPMIAFAIVIAIDFMLITICLLYSYRSFPTKMRWIASKKKCIELIKWSWPLCMAAIIGLTQARIEFLIIERILGIENVGQYSAALKWIEFFSVPGFIISTAIFPTMAASKGNIDLIIQKTYFLMISVFLISIPLMILMWMVMDSVYGSAYLAAKSIFIFMIFRPLLAYLGTVRSMSIKLDGIIWYDLICAVIGAIIAIISAPFLIHYYGLIGAVISAYLSYTISNLILDIIFYRKNLKNLSRSILLFKSVMRI
jgi:O-antigen/teichoic acid export membrane protein